MASAGGIGLRRDRRLDPFVAAMSQRFPGLTGRWSQPPFEFDVSGDHVLVALPWSQVEELAGVVAEPAWRNGLALYDPQRELVGLPSPFAEAPLGGQGIERHVEWASQAMDTIASTAASVPDGDADALRRSVGEALRGIGARQMSPLGFEITAEIESEYIADPTRIPTPIQTPERRDELFADLKAGRPPDRHRTLMWLAGWDTDAKVADALRASLDAEDVFEAGLAAMGLVRQGNPADLPAILELVRQLSPADGGSIDAMLMPLQAALELAARIGPEAIEDVKVRAREWSGGGPVRGQARIMLDEPLAGGPHDNLD